MTPRNRPFGSQSKRLTYRGRTFTKFVSPLGFMVFLTFTSFAILGISGGLLMLYYSPYVFFGSLVFIGAVAYAGVYLRFRATAPPPRVRVTYAPKRFPIYEMTSNEWRAVVISLLGFQVLFDIYSSQAFFAGFENIVLLQIGVGLIAFGMLVHLYRIGAE